MKSILLALAAALLLFPGIAAADDYPLPGESLVYWQSAVSTWKAADNVGRRTEESGTIHGIGITSDIAYGRSVWRPMLEGSFGASDHDAFADNGSRVDSSDTRVYALRAGVDYLYGIPVLKRSTLRPVVGGEVRVTRRTVSDGKAGGYKTYRDSWTAVNLRLGLQFLLHDAVDYEDDTPSRYTPRVRFRAEAGILLPAVLNVAFESQPVSTSANHAGMHPSYYAEAGPALGAFRPVLYYEGVRLVRSPLVSGDTVGIRIGWAF